MAVRNIFQQPGETEPLSKLTAAVLEDIEYIVNPSAVSGCLVVSICTISPSMHAALNLVVCVAFTVILSRAVRKAMIRYLTRIRVRGIFYPCHMLYVLPHTVSPA